MLRETPNRNRKGSLLLLHALGARFGVDQGFEERQDVAAVFDHAGKDITQSRLSLGLAMPFQENRLWNFNVAAEFLSGMPAQEQAVEEGCLPLREVEVVLGFFGRVGSGWKRRVCVGLHLRIKTEKAVYRKFLPRQVVPRSRDDIFVIPATKALRSAWFDAGSGGKDSLCHPANEDLPRFHKYYQQLSLIIPVCPAGALSGRIHAEPRH